MEIVKRAIERRPALEWTHMWVVLVRTIERHRASTRPRATASSDGERVFGVRLRLSCSTCAELARRARQVALRGNLYDKQKPTAATSGSDRIGRYNKASATASHPNCRATKRRGAAKLRILADGVRRTMGSRAKTLQTARVVVVGAGTAGIAAATRLLEAGFGNVLLLEAEGRVGGRVHTVPFADNVVDLGAQWCHGEKQNPIYELVRGLGMLESTGTIYDDYKCVRSDGEVLSEPVADLLKSIAFNSIPERQQGLRRYEGSLGAYLTETFWRELDKSPEIDRAVAHEFFENFKKFECSVEASDHLFEVSGQGHLEYWLCEGDLLLNWKDKGFRAFLRLLLQAKEGAADDLGVLNKRVCCNRRVEHIDWRGAGERGVRIKCWNGDVIEADHVICTVSLGVLKENHRRMFTPALPPAKCRAIEGLKLGTVDKFFMEFAAPFGPVDWSGFCLLWREADLVELRNSEYFWLESVFGFYRVPHQPRLLQGWIIGAHARHMETLAEAAVLEALLWLFRKFFSFAVPAPKNFLRTQWHANPNFRGSYTFRSMYAEELRTGGWDLAEPLTDGGGKPVVQFAGEATHTHFYSTVHGALESGWREAQRLIAYYQQRPAQL